MRTLVSIVAVGSLVTACGSDDGESAEAVPNDQSQNAGEGDPVTIGVITSSSGPAASLGLPEEEGIRAFDAADVDCGGRRLQFVFENDQSDPAQAGAAARTLVQNDDVMGIIGPSITANMLAAIPIVLPAETPIVFLTPQPYPEYNEEPFAFSPNYAPFALAAERSIGFFTEIGIDPGEVAFMAGDDATGQSINEGFAAAGVTNVQLAPADGTDFTPLLRNLESDGPRHFQLWLSRGTPGGIARRQQVEIGFDVPTLFTSALLSRDFFEAAGSAADGAFTFVTQALLPPDAIDDPDVSAQAAAYQEAYAAFGREPLADGGVTAPMAWDAALSYCEAVREVVEAGDEVTRASLRDALENQDIAGAGGMIRRSVDDHAGFDPASFVPVMIDGTTVVPVDAVDGAWVPRS